eukprot:scaffold5639_cov70-Cyclotella_meneghiniana.AAC.5
MSEPVSRKRSISDAMEDNPSINTNDEGLRRRRVHPPEPSDAAINNNLTKQTTATTTTTSSSIKAPKHKSVVPLSMQLLRPFWEMSYCADPNCRLPPSSHDYKQQHHAASASVAPPIMIDSRLRSVSTASLSGIDTASPSTNNDNGTRHASSEAMVMLSAQKSSVDYSSVSSHEEVTHYNTNNNALSSNQTLHPTTATTIQEGSIEHILQEYTSACTIYGCAHRLNPGVLTTLRYSLPTLRVSGSFFDADMLALCEILLKHCNTTLSFIKRLDFSVAGKEGRHVNGNGGGSNNKFGFRSHGAYALSRVLGVSQFVEEVYVPNNRIGPYGAASLFEVLKDNSAVKVLWMKGCRIGERGALSFVRHILSEDGKSALREVDMSNNRIGFHGCIEIERGLKAKFMLLEDQACNDAREEKDSTTTAAATTTTQMSPSLAVNLDANMVLQEVMNSVTHGLGVVLAIIATILLTKRVQGLSSNYKISCAIYSTALIVLYTTSTLYHSFFALRNVHSIFSIVDKCAIYFLLAGSYSPFLMIALQDNPVWSTHLLWFIWACALRGMFVEATMSSSWRHKAKFSLCMYVGMGWCCLVCLPDLVAVLPSKASVLLVSGGVAYTGGM